jgi:hypothetical protein
VKPDRQVQASAAAMDRALDDGLPLEDLVRVVAARADQRDLGQPPDLTDPQVLAAHLRPAAATVDETHVRRALRRR